MSAVVNDRDVLLQAAPVRNVNPGLDKAILITASAPVFKVTNLGVGSPSTITLTANLINIQGTVTWTASGATVTPSGNTASLAFVNMSGASATITAQITYNGTLFTASFIVAKVLDGTNGSNGTNGTNGAAGTRGTVQIVGTGYGAWSDAGATNEIITATGGVPINRDMVTLTNNTSFSQTRFYSSGSWLTLAAYVNGNMVVDGTLSCASLIADTMTGQNYRTAGSGSRVTINDSSNNRVHVYNSGGTLVAEMGGSGSTSIGSLSATMAALHTSGSAIYGTATSGEGVFGETTSGGCGIYGKSSANGTGVYGLAVSSSSVGMHGESQGLGGIGIKARCATGTALDVATTASGPGISVTAIGNAINITGGANGVVQTGGGANYMRNLLPSTDGGYSLGESGTFRWSALYANSGTITTSDNRTKKEVQDSDLGLAFIETLRPVKYKQIVAENITVDEVVESGGVTTTRNVVTPRPGTRFHYGLIAQEVQAALAQAGADAAAIWVLSDPADQDSQQSLRYEELISPLIRAVQELAAQVAELRAQQTSPND